MNLKDDLPTIKRRPTSIKEKIQQWKKQRDNIISAVSGNSNHDLYLQKIVNKLINLLCDKSTCFPLEMATLNSKISTDLDDSQTIKNLLDKFSSQKLIELTECNKTFIINSVNCSGLRENYPNLNFDCSEPQNSLEDLNKSGTISESSQKSQSKKRLLESDETESSNLNEENKNSVECILSLQSAKEKENKKISEEILELLSKPTARELSLVEQFRSATGHVQEFCQYGTREECMRVNHVGEPCSKLHFLKIIQKHTDESLGDCSFLNTCFHMDSCKYVHYKVEVKDPNITASNFKFENLTSNSNNIPLVKALATATEQPFKRVLFPPQWIRCDLRFFDMSVLGKFAVVMADPPWDIHMELPYGTMSDDEMRNLNIPCLQDEGLIFLWVTGRAMELGRDCLKLWGYERCDELIWVKTNQLQRIIRTGRTGHWINHGKEHCLVGVKGNPKNINRGLDCDVIVAEVRATSHKPDEIYGIIERLSPGTRKIELFGRQHNTQPNWVTLGNQLSNIKIVDPQLVDAYTSRYPEEVISDL